MIPTKWQKSVSCFDYVCKLCSFIIQEAKFFSLRWTYQGQSKVAKFYWFVLEHSLNKPSYPLPSWYQKLQAYYTATTQEKVAGNKVAILDMYEIYDGHRNPCWISSRNETSWQICLSLKRLRLLKFRGCKKITFLYRFIDNVLVVVRANV